MSPSYTARATRVAALAAVTLTFSLLAASVASAGATPDKKTERTWKASCASCHGADGKAATEKGKEMGVADMTSAKWQKEFSDDKIRKAIVDGIKETRDGKNKEMDSFKEKLKPEQVDAFVTYIRAFAQ